MVTSETSDADDGDHYGRSYAALGGLITWQCGCGNCNGSRDVGLWMKM